MFYWRGGRVVEGARLESVYRGNSIMGSNPILSAIKYNMFYGIKFNSQIDILKFKISNF